MSTSWTTSPESSSPSPRANSRNATERRRTQGSRSRLIRWLVRLLQVSEKKVDLDGRQIELARRCFDQLASLRVGIVDEAGQNPIQGSLDARLPQAHRANFSA